MKVCKVKPDYSVCSECIDTQQMLDVVYDCSKCKLNTENYELLQIGTSFWSGDYAMVQKDGKIQKVSLMSLKKFRRESFIKQYSYRPITRKHLPYQRRNY